MTAFSVSTPFNLGTSATGSITGAIRPGNPYSIAWTEVVASTSVQWGGFWVRVYDYTTAGIVSVAVGASGSEVRIASFAVGMATYSSKPREIYIPIAVAASSRVSMSYGARTTSNFVFQICAIPASLFPAIPSFTRMDCGPFNLDGGSTTWGEVPAIDPGAVAHTKSAYVELYMSGANSIANNLMNGDSLDHTYKYLGMVLGDGGNSAQTGQDRLWDLAYGAASSEVNFLENAQGHVNGGEQGSGQHGFWMPWGRASGDRISARMQSSITDATDRIGSVYLIGLR